MSLGMNDLKPGVFFIYEGHPYMVLETHHLKMQQRRPVMQTKMKNMLNGKSYERNFQQSDVFEEADVSYQNVKFLYSHRDEFWFAQEKDPSQRFKLDQEIIGDGVKFLKANTVVKAILFNPAPENNNSKTAAKRQDAFKNGTSQKIINIELPIKMDFKVIEAPPTIRGDTAQGGVKQVKLETGATINVPLFINEGDTVRINTQSGEYTERVEKK